MNGKFLALIAITFLMFTVPVSAHHGGAGYDNGKVVTISGTVVDFQYINPHCITHIDVKGSNGTIQHWTMEAPPPSLMKRSSGWFKDMMKPGDEVTVGLHQARNGAYVGKIAQPSGDSRVAADAGNGLLIVNGKPIKAEATEQ